MKWSACHPSLNENLQLECGEKRRNELVSAAKDTVRKDKRIYIRISNRDLKAIQLKAAEEGLPYQTLVSSIIHKYITGSLKDISANKRMQ